MPKPNIEYHLTDFNSDEEVGQDNAEVWGEDLNKLMHSIEKLEKIEDLFILAE